MTGSRNRFVWQAIAMVVLLGLIVAGGFAIHRLGWSQGYAAAELAVQGEEVPTPPLAPPGWRPIGFGRGGLMLITLLLGFLFFAFVGKLLRVIMWGAMAGPAMIGPSMAWDGIGGSWRHPRHRAHGPVRPWYGPWCGQPGESPETSEDTQDLEA